MVERKILDCYLRLNSEALQHRCLESSLKKVWLILLKSLGPLAGTYAIQPKLSRPTRRRAECGYSKKRYDRIRVKPIFFVRLRQVRYEKMPLSQTAESYLRYLAVLKNDEGWWNISKHHLHKLMSKRIWRTYIIDIFTYGKLTLDGFLKRFKTLPPGHQGMVGSGRASVAAVADLSRAFVDDVGQNTPLSFFSESYSVTWGLGLSFTKPRKRTP